MAYQRVCSMDDLWQGEMDLFEVEGREILLLHTSKGEIRACDPRCPHQEFQLIDGDFDGETLICSAHHWEFDVASGASVNPTGDALKIFSVKIEGDDIQVNMEELEH